MSKQFRKGRSIHIHKTDFWGKFCGIFRLGDFKSEIIPFFLIAYETRKFLLVCVA